MSIKQREDETLRSYITRFNKETFSIDEANDKILVAAFTNRLRKFYGRGKELTEVMNDESVLFTESSRSLETRPLKAFIITSICSFIAYISATISGGACP